MKILTWSINMTAKNEKIGYHTYAITKGKLGNISKIQEELDELKDASNQECKIMALVELADMLGAIEAYMVVNLPGFTLNDLIKMKDITKRAFENGFRT